jgi:hypothetical protein
MTVHENPLYAFDLEPERGLLRLVWTEKTAKMTDDEFMRALSLYADCALKYRTPALLVDLRNFRHQPGPEIGKWRSEKIVPQYEAAGVKKFAYVIRNDVPMPAPGPKVDAKETFETRHFRTTEESERWLTG